MKRSITLFLILTVIGIFVLADTPVKDIIITPVKPSSLKVQIWMDRSTGATYYPGDNVRIYFKTSENAYVIIYDFATDGSVRVLFPNFFQRNNYVRGGVVYTIPNPAYNYSLTVTGPNGREFLEAVASLSPSALPNVPLAGANPFLEYKDGQQYMQKMKLELMRESIAVATTYFYVGYVPQMGTVNFTSSPMRVSLYVDGTYEGETPKTLQLPVGNHVATFVYQGRSLAKSFTVQPGQYSMVNGVISIMPVQPLSVKVNVNTYPSGALVFVDGKMLGISPCTFKLAVGTYEFTVVKPDYKTVVRTVTIQNDINLNFQLNKIESYTSF